MRRERRRIRQNRITREGETIQSSLHGGVVSTTACIRRQHRNETEVRGMPHGWLDPDLQRDADNSERFDSAIAQDQLERRADKRGHADLVKHELARQRRELRKQLCLRRARWKGWSESLHLIDALPRHRRA